MLLLLIVVFLLSTPLLIGGNPIFAPNTSEAVIQNFNVPVRCTRTRARTHPPRRPPPALLTPRASG